jgi:hypothetical protein
MLCPGSFQLEEAVEKNKPLPDVVTEYSYRGECLHTMPNVIIEDNALFKVGDMVGIAGSEVEYCLTNSDVEAVEYVSNEIRADKSLLDPDDTVLWEQKVDLTKYGIGNSKDGNRVDCVFLKQKTIDIYEFKFGSGYIDEPKFNLQVIAYAIGCRDAYGTPLEGINITILQPDAFKDEWRRRSYSFTNEELSAWEKKIIDIIEAQKASGAPLCKGDHCGFCKVKKMCPMHRDAFLNVPQHIAPEDYFQSIDPVRRKEFYEALLTTQSWIKSAIEACEELAIGGVDISGYHIGTGRATRKWNVPDTELAEKLPSLIVEKMMSPAEAEKQHGKKFFRENLEQHVESIVGNPKLCKD